MKQELETLSASINEIATGERTRVQDQLFHVKRQVDSCMTCFDRTPDDTMATNIRCVRRTIEELVRSMSLEEMTEESEEFFLETSKIISKL